MTRECDEIAFGGIEPMIINQYTTALALKPSGDCIKGYGVNILYATVKRRLTHLVIYITKMADSLTHRSLLNKIDLFFTNSRQVRCTVGVVYTCAYITLVSIM